jgi:sugar O-acyltransferase (sialic acid O-acetyltransferase NeuD family)
MALPNLIIIGAGGHGLSIIDVVESSHSHHVVGFVDSLLEKGEQHGGYPILGKEQDLSELVELHDAEVFIAVGDNFQRNAVSNRVAENTPNVVFATLVHEHAYVSQRASLSSGSVIMAGAVVNAGCEVATGVIINTNASLDHEAKMGAYSSLAPGAIVGGRVSIGERTSVGLGARVIHNLCISDDVCVGAGSLLIRDINKAGSLVFGSPAKLIRDREPDEAYL